MIASSKDKLLFTPGPLTTSHLVKQAMLHDAGSWHLQWHGFEKNGQFRFTPPTHALLALAQALDELDAEGGVAARGNRYADNHRALIEGMRSLGFAPFLRPELQSYIITAFGYPNAPTFRFPDFYRQLSDRGMIIYPGKLTRLDTFRIGTIGRLFPEDIAALVNAVEAALGAMGCALPVSQAVEPNAKAEANAALVK